MNINFSCKNECCGNVTYAWVIESKVNDYNLSIEFCGGINEDDEQDLYGSLFADIELTEMHHCEPDILTEIQNLISDELNIEREKIYAQFGDDKETLSVKNESSFNSTMQDFNTILTAVTSVLLKHEMTAYIPEQEVIL